MSFERLLPLACVVFFGLLGVGVRAGLQRVREGSTGVHLFRSGRGDQTVREIVFVAIGAVLLGHALAAAFAPGWLAPISFVPATVARPLALAGAAVVLAATLLTFAAQMGMGASWRIGIEEGARPGLVTGGLYSFSRNPIYLFVIVALVGFILLVPTWVSLACLPVAVLLVKQQVAAEEDYLARTYGDEFQAYARRVGRFVPFLGRTPF